MSALLPDVTILSTADFHASVWTNKQHLATGLSQHTDVTYIESLGLRQPGLNRADMTRVLNKVRPARGGAKASAPRAAVPDNLTILTPKVLPLHRFRAARAVNQRLIDSDLLPCAAAGPDSVLWTFSPLTYGLERHFGHVVYHSVDLIHTAPGIPAAAVLAGEKHLLAVADTVIASSRGVRDHLIAAGREHVLLWENVASVELFAGAVSERLPRAIFAGNLTPTKLDFALLQAVADAGIDLAVSGPIAIDGAGGTDQVQRLLAHPKVNYLGNLALPDLAREVGRSMVGLIPYEVNDHTAGVFPMKVYEYLAAGLEVISTRLPSLTARAIHGMRLRGDRDGFAAATATAVRTFDQAAAAGRMRSAQSHSWTARIDAAVDLLRGSRAARQEAVPC